MMNFTGELANDILAGRLTRQEVVEEYGHIVDLDFLDMLVQSAGCVTYHDDGTMTFHMDDEQQE